MPKQRGEDPRQEFFFFHPADLLALSDAEACAYFWKLNPMQRVRLFLILLRALRLSR